MKTIWRPGSLPLICTASVALVVLTGNAVSQVAPPTRHAEPAHAAHSAAEAVGNASTTQNRDVDLKRIDEELQVLQQSINNLSKKPAQNSDETSPAATPANAAAPVASRLPASATPSAAPAATRTGSSLPSEDQFFAFKGDKSPAQTLILLLVSGIMGMVGQGARTIVGLKKLSDKSQTAASQADTFSASRLAVGLMIGFVAGVAGGMTPKVFNAPTITSDVLFYLASVGYMGVDAIEAFTNSISSRSSQISKTATPGQTIVSASVPDAPPPTSHDLAPTRPSPPQPPHSSNEEINEALQYAADIAAAAQKHGIPEEYICGVGSRESLWGLALRPKGPAGTGDWAPRNGHMPPDGLGWGRGLMQIDYASHPIAQTGDWRDPCANIAYGGDILGQNYDYFRRARYPGVDPLRAAIAAYNCGVGNVERAIHAGEDVDARTTGCNYSQDVLRRAAAFKPYFGTSTLTS